MKKLLGLLLLSTVVQAATLSSNYDQQFLNANAERNFILNSGAEKTDANVTDSSNIHSRSTSSPIAGVASHLIDGTSTSQNVDFVASNFETGILGTNCEALFQVNGDASLYTATVRINSADVTSAMTLPNTGSYSQNVSIVFPCGTSGSSPVLRITSTSASAAAIKIDSVYLGKAVSLGNVNTVGDWQSWTPTGGWSGANVTYTGRYRRVGDSLEGQVHVALAGAPSGTFLTINLPSGLTIDTAKLSSTSGDKPVGVARAFDAGTKGYDGVVNYSSTTAVQALAASGASPPDYAAIQPTVPFTFGNTDGVSVFFTVPILGWTSTSSYSLMNTYWKVDANISGANPSLGTSAVTSYTGIENSALTLTNNTGTGTIAAQIGCSSTNSPSGTTCSVGNESVSVAFTPLGTFPQDVLACASFQHFASTGAGGVLSSAFQIVETATNAQTVVQEGRDRINSGTETASQTLIFPHKVCGTFTLSSPGQKMFRLMYEQSTSGTVSNSLILADANAAVGQRDIHWTVEPLSYNTPAPILVGGVTSGNTSGAERVERITYTDTTINRQSGSWVSSITSNGTGDKTLNIPSGIFSAIPTCVCSSQDPDTSITIEYNCRITSATTTAVRAITTFGQPTNVGGGNYITNVICMGPR